MQSQKRIIDFEDALKTMQRKKLSFFMVFTGFRTFLIISPSHTRKKNMEMVLPSQAQFFLRSHGLVLYDNDGFITIGKGETIDKGGNNEI